MKAVGKSCLRWMSVSRGIGSVGPTVAGSVTGVCLSLGQVAAQQWSSKAGVTVVVEVAACPPLGHDGAILGRPGIRHDASLFAMAGGTGSEAQRHCERAWFRGFTRNSVESIMDELTSRPVSRQEIACSII